MRRGKNWALGPQQACRLLYAVLLALFMAGAAAADNYALLIGIDSYPHARPLKGAVNDILEIKRLVVEQMKFPEANVRVLLNEQATKTNILAALTRLSEQTKPGDAVLWYYSGHGWVQKDVDGDERLQDPDDALDEVLVPYDAVPWPRERALDPNPTMVVDDEIAQALSKMAGRRMLVVFDSCHSGTATRALPGESETRALYENYALPSTPKTKSLKRPQETMDMNGQVVFLAAASPVQAASDLGEYDGKRHGAFTAGLLRSIEQLGPNWQQKASMESLFQSARRDMLDHGFATQTPSITAREGFGKFTVAQFLNPPASAEIAAVQSGGGFELQVASNKYQFEDGELLEVAVESARPGYLYLFDVDAEQKVTQLLPNRFSPDNRVQAGVARQVPDKGDRYQFKAGKPYGRSTILAIVTVAPWTQADKLALPASFEPISDPQSKGLRDLLNGLQGSGGATEWASQKVVVQILPKEAQTGGSQPGPSTPAPAPAVTAAPLAPEKPPATVAPASAALDDSNLTAAEQANLPQSRPQLFARLQKLAERFSPVFWQDVSGEFDSHFRPWRDFFVRYDFDQTQLGPNWPEPPRFQDENKRLRNGSLTGLLTPDPRRTISPIQETPGVFRVQDSEASAVYQLDLRPVVYWAVLSTPTHYFFHYVCFHAEDWKPLFGHTGDLEGTTIVVDRQTEKMVAAFTLAHDDVGVVRSLDDEADANIGVLVNPNAESRGLFDGDDGRPVDGSLAMDTARDGEPAPKEHQEIYVESRGHGQYGPHKIKKSRYVIYANYFPDDTWTTAPFDRQKYPLTDRFADVLAKHKYNLVYIGSGPASESRGAGERTLWGEYYQLPRFSGGVNPPWDWRDNLFFKTGWWKDPRMIKKIGDSGYRINPYLAGKK